MTNILRVVTATTVELASCRLEIDEYVPLRFRSYERPLGAGYIRLGNLATSLLELIIEPSSNAVRGVTITSYERISQWPAFHVTSVSEGLPVLSHPFDQRRSVDLDEGFEVATREGEILAFWKRADVCEAFSFAERVQFLVSDSLLCGIVFLGISNSSMRVFARHAKKG